MTKSIRDPIRRLAVFARFIVVWLAASAAMPDRASADALSDGTFRSEVVGLIRAKHPDWPVSVDADLEQVLIGRRKIFLGNVYKWVTGLDATARKAKVIAFVEQAVAPMPPQASEGAETLFERLVRLRIQIIPKEYLEQEASIAHRPFSDRLRIAYALDERDRYQLLTEPMVAALGIDTAKFHATAVENLEITSKDVAIEVSATGKAGRFATAATEDGYAAARLLLPAFMERLKRRLGADEIIVAVPTRDLLIAWTPDSDAKTRLAVIVRQEAHAGAHRRSDELFRFGPQGLNPLDAASLAAHGR